MSVLASSSSQGDGVPLGKGLADLQEISQEQFVMLVNLTHSGVSRILMGSWTCVCQQTKLHPFIFSKNWNTESLFIEAIPL